MGFKLRLTELEKRGGERRRPAGSVADAARRPPRVRARRGRVRAGHRARGAERAARAGARRAAHVRLDERRLPARAPSAARVDRRAARAGRRAAALASCTSRRTTRRARRRRSRSSSTPTATATASRSARPSCASSAAARRAGPSCTASCSSNGGHRLGAWPRMDRRTRRPASRSPRPTRSSSGCARRSSRPARRGFGQFAGLHPLDDGRLLAASTDCVGTKLILARQRGALRACGADLAAHCINDVITCGAEPLILLDYVAASQIELEQVAELVEGAAEVCRAAGVRARRRRDGRVAGHLPRRGARLRRNLRRRRRRSRSTARRSKPATSSSASRRPGVHANGFTLVRKVLEEEDYDGPDLLAPTRLYLDVVRAPARPGARRSPT